MLEVKVPLTFCSCLSFQALFFPSLIGLLFSGLFYGDQTHLSSMCNIGKTLWEASVFKVLGCEKSLQYPFKLHESMAVPINKEASL